MSKDDDKAAKVCVINAGSTQNIADICKKLDCKITYISTDYAFNVVYGQTKLEGELAVNQTLEKVFIVRIA